MIIWELDGWPQKERRVKTTNYTHAWVSSVTQ